MASKAPGPRRREKDAVAQLDGLLSLIQEDVLGGCLRIPKREVHQCLRPDGLLRLSMMTMSKDNGKGGREDHRFLM